MGRSGCNGPPLSPYLEEGRIARRFLGKLVGRLSFSHTSLFGKFARTQMRPMRRKFHRVVYSARLFPYERTVCGWREEFIAEFTPRLASPRPDKTRWIIYNDAAKDPRCFALFCAMGAVLPPELHAACSARAPAAWPYFSRPSSLIYGLELMALALCFEGRAAFLKGKRCWVYLDNNNCLAALVRCDSAAGVIAVLVARAGRWYSGWIYACGSRAFIRI